MVTKTETTIAGASTNYSTPVAMRGRHILGIHDEWTGTLTGTRTLWASNKEKPDDRDDDDWVDVTSETTLANPAGSADNDAAVVNPAPFVWYREKLVVSSGAGTWTSLVNQVIPGRSV